MICKKIIICIALGLFAITVRATTVSIYWTDGNGKVTYNTNSTTSQVVKMALQLFSGDMEAVTGFKAEQKANAPIQIYQLDQLTNKEFSAVEKLGAPLHKIITIKDAYYIGTRNKKVIVVGSNARGTAYGIMHLSQLAGVSPWAEWNDLQPQPRKSIFTEAGQEWTEIPRVEFRGIALNDSKWMSLKNYSSIARLMLRLKLNTLWQTDGKHEGTYDKAVADSFDICIAENHKVTEFTGKKHKKHKRNIEDMRMFFDDPQTDISSLSPGQMKEMLGDKTENAWIANVTNPKGSGIQLSMMASMAWKQNALNTGSKAYLQNWLCDQFGTTNGKRILPLLEEYYLLTNIRKPAYMSMPYGDNEFHSDEFGNELERYLYRYDRLKAKVEDTERSLPAEQKDGFFEVVKYPILSAALIAEKELEAQEARHIARPGLFANDNEAKAAAALSLSAYNKLLQLDKYYSNLRNGKWKDFVNTDSTETQPPLLPGALTSDDIKKYKKEAFNRSEDLKSLSTFTGNIFAKNAYSYTSATDSIQQLSLLGHSNKAVKLAKGAGLHYEFYSNMSGDARFTLAAIPNLTATGKSLRVSVRIDDMEPVECQLHEEYNSKQWKTSLWRGQVQKSFYTTLEKGKHSVDIEALDDNVIIDQWILDYDVDREYYIIPVAE